MSPSTRRTSCSGGSPRFLWNSAPQSPALLAERSVKGALAHADPWCMRRVLGMVGVLAALVGIVSGLAAPASSAPVLSRVAVPSFPAASGPWTTDRFAQFYGKSITGEMFSSAVVGDITGSGRSAIVAGYPDGNVYAWNAADGARLLKFSTGTGAVQSSPALVDLNNDGVLDILAANTAGDVVGF